MEKSYLVDKLATLEENHPSSTTRKIIITDGQNPSVMAKIRR